jgi:hypothetical protein
LSDGRRKDNLSQAQRRRAGQKAAQAGRRGRNKRKDDTLSRAKDVLRRTGKTVFDAQIELPQFKGTIIVDTRRMAPEAVIELAEQILERERLRNNELRRQHGLEPLPPTALRG